MNKLESAEQLGKVEPVVGADIPELVLGQNVLHGRGNFAG